LLALLGWNDDSAAAGWCWSGATAQSNDKARKALGTAFSCAAVHTSRMVAPPAHRRTGRAESVVRTQRAADRIRPDEHDLLDNVRRNIDSSSVESPIC